MKRGFEETTTTMMEESGDGGGGACCDVDLGSTLKKVRISMTPGELRLDRDLCELSGGWTRVGDRVWVLRPHVRLDRLNDPLQLVLRVGDAKAYLQLSRMYPHVPPVVAHLENSHNIQRVVVSVVEPAIDDDNNNNGVAMEQEQQQQMFHQQQQQQQQHAWDDSVMMTTPGHHHHHPQQNYYCRNQGSTATPTTTTLTFDQWSPIRQLGELLHFIIHALEHEKWRREGGTMPPSAPSKHSTMFAPNRFDLGYDRSTVAISTRPMEC